MIFVRSENIESALRSLRYEYQKSGIPASLKLKAIAKKSLRRRKKEEIARKRKLLHAKRRRFYSDQDDKR